jgi:hypothetical protein
VDSIQPPAAASQQQQQQAINGVGGHLVPAAIAAGHDDDESSLLIAPESQAAEGNHSTGQQNGTVPTLGNGSSGGTAHGGSSGSSGGSNARRKGQLVLAEQRAKGQVKRSVYMAYLTAMGPLLAVPIAVLIGGWRFVGGGRWCVWVGWDGGCAPCCCRLCLLLCSSPG